MQAISNGAAAIPERPELESVKRYALGCCNQRDAVRHVGIQQRGEFLPGRREALLVVFPDRVGLAGILRERGDHLVHRRECGADGGRLACREAVVVRVDLAQGGGCARHVGLARCDHGATVVERLAFLEVAQHDQAAISSAAIGCMPS